MSDAPHNTARAEPARIADCWNRIGVRGDRSCKELERHIHCRNCPVYSAAARQLLDEEPPPEYRAESTREFSRAKVLAELDTHSALIFRLAAEWLALATGYVKEIVSPRPVHSMPHRRDGILLGVANVRGELLACFSLYQALGLEGSTKPDNHNSRVAARLLVMQHRSHSAVCSVDEVCGIVRYHPRELTQVPATVGKAASTYTRSVLAWQDRFVGLLDAESLLSMLERNLA
jgi:chemotaxis-related protein WspD